jgi:hypothetical protein
MLHHALAERKSRGAYVSSDKPSAISAPAQGSPAHTGIEIDTKPNVKSGMPPFWALQSHGVPIPTRRVDRKCFLSPVLPHLLHLGQPVLHFHCAGTHFSRLHTVSSMLIIWLVLTQTRRREVAFVCSNAFVASFIARGSTSDNAIRSCTKGSAPSKTHDVSHCCLLRARPPRVSHRLERERDGCLSTVHPITYFGQRHGFACCFVRLT